MDCSGELAKFDSQFKGLVCGMDEAGKGPLAGPVVAAAIIMKNGCKIYGVNDSKKLSEKKRDGLFPEILENALSVSVAILSNAEIDELNIDAATKLAMKRAAENIKITPDIVLIDGNRPPALTVPNVSIIRGDEQSFSIACASIVAKVIRDRIMYTIDKHFPNYGFAKHKGYGTAAHFEALRLYGATVFHRQTFLRKFYAK